MENGDASAGGLGASWRALFSEIDRDVNFLKQERKALQLAKREPAASEAAERVSSAYKVVRGKSERVRIVIESNPGVFTCVMSDFVKIRPPSPPTRNATRQQIVNYRATLRNFDPRLPIELTRDWLMNYLGIEPLEAQDLVDHVEHIGPVDVLQNSSQALAVEVKKRLEVIGAHVRIVEDATPSLQGEARKSQREPISESVRHEVWRRDGGQCVDCGSRERLEYDHIIPVSRGGSNTVRNLELRCEVCNRSKGARI